LVSEIDGKSFGIIGYGAIGSRVATIAKAFGCEVYCYTRHPKQIDGIKFVSLEEVMQCDIVSVHVPSNSETYHLIDKNKIGLMKKNSILINMARGPIVNYEALSEALNSNLIGGACIDVFEEEPPINANHPLINSKNCVLTPHVGFATKEAFIKRAHIIFDNINSYLDGNPKNFIE